MRHDFTPEEMESLIRDMNQQEFAEFQQALAESATAEEWLQDNFADTFTRAFADCHHRLWDWFDRVRLDKYQPAICEAWARSLGKCLDGETLVLMSDGSQKRVAEIQVGDRIQSHNLETGRIEEDRVSRVWATGTKPCISLRTRTSKHVIVTREHRMLSFDGWKEAGDIGLYDRIASPRNTRIDGKEGHSDEEVRFLAYLIAEGGLNGGSTVFTNADPVIVDDFRKCADALGYDVRFQCRYGYRVVTRQKPSRAAKGEHYSDLRKWVKAQGIMCKAINKRVPAWVFGIPERQRWMFLAAMIDTDGWVDVKAGSINITLASQGLVQDIAYLFASVGAVTTTYYKPNKCAGAWNLIVDQDALGMCIQKLPLILKKGKLVQCGDKPRHSLRDTYPSRIGANLPPGVNRRLRREGFPKMGGLSYGDVTREKVRTAIKGFAHPLWVSLESADVFWDKVVAIEDAGDRVTYDLEVEKNHNLITNLLVTHNSTSVEHAVGLVAVRQTRKFALYVSAIQVQANAHVQTIAAILRSIGLERKVDDYGVSPGWRRDHLQLNNFSVSGYGVDGAMRGIKVGSTRPDLIILDDIDEEDDTPETVRAKIDAITNKILPAGSADCIVCFVQNLIHEGSVMSQLMDGRADFLNDRNRIEPVQAVKDLTYEIAVRQETGRRYYSFTGGEPTFLDLKTWERKANEWGIKAFLREAQHEVESIGGYFFDVSYWKPKNGLSPENIIDRDEVPAGLRVCLAWDLAATQGGGDYTCGVLLGVDINQIVYVLDVIRGQWSSERVRAKVLLESGKVRAHYPNYVIRLPQDPAQAGKDQAVQYARMLKDFLVRIQSISGNKAHRADGWAEAVNLGNVKLVKADWNWEYINEHKNFQESGYKGRDDQIDPSADAFNHLDIHRSFEATDRYSTTAEEAVEYADPEFDPGPPSPAQIMEWSRQQQNGGFDQAAGW